MNDVVTALGKAYEWERPNATGGDGEVLRLDRAIGEQLGEQWKALKLMVQANPGSSQVGLRALTLLYTHFLRIPADLALQHEQQELLLHAPLLLNSLLSITVTRSWLLPTLATLRMHAYLAQAIPPGRHPMLFAQLPGVQEEEAQKLTESVETIEELVDTLQHDGDDRVQDVKRAAENWGKLDLLHADFKVIGDRLVTPSSIVYLVIKARLVNPSLPKIQISEEAKTALNDEQRDYEFLSGRKDAEEMSNIVLSSAHAPHWPAARKPGFWVVLAEPKGNKVVVPPMKITDIPYATASQPDIYRSYKMQFQAPAQVNTFPWKLYFVSDTFVGEEIVRDIQLKIDDAAVLTEQVEEDEISDPEEDSLAGQMAMMRGGAVKKRSDHSDDESSTDDDEDEDENDGDDSSDSD